jgi:hypothetical protein
MNRNRWRNSQLCKPVRLFQKRRRAASLKTKLAGCGVSDSPFALKRFCKGDYIEKYNPDLDMPARRRRRRLSAGETTAFAGTRLE